MGAGSSGSSGNRNITPRYEAVKSQLNATYDLNKALNKDGHSPASGLFDANNKAKSYGIIDTPQFNRNAQINKDANNAKHKW